MGSLPAWGAPEREIKTNKGVNMKDKLPDLRQLSTYEEALDHIFKCHGEEGKKITTDENQAPFMWHEIVGHGPDNDSDHDHYGNAMGNISEMMELVNKIIEDPEFRAKFEAQLSSEEALEAKKRIDEKTRSLLEGDK